MKRTCKWTAALSMALGLLGGCASGSDTNSGEGGGEAGGSSGGDGGAASTGGAMSTGGTTQPDTCVALDGVCGAGEDCGCSDCQGTALCNPGQCVDNGVCTVDDACTCDDCLTDAFCSDPASCHDDGVCDSFNEGCQCADCFEQADCKDNGPVSNVPGAEFVDITPGAASGLVLRSLNFVQEPSGGQTFQQFYAEVANQGSETFCLVQLEASYKKAGGGLIAKTYGYTAGEPYTLGDSAVPMPCIEPGKSAGMYDNGFVDTTASLGAVAKVEYQFGGYTKGSNVPHPLTPAILSASVVQTFGADYYALSGAVKNDSGQPIYNLAMKVYPINAQGLIYDELLDHHLSTLWGNATWSYETTSAQGQFSKYLQTVDFIAGAAFAPPKPDEAGGSAGSPEAGAYAAMRQRLGVVRANREAHRGAR